MDAALKITFAYLVKMMAETVGVTESKIRRLYSNRFAAEAIGITESLLKRGLSIYKAAESINLADAAVRRGRSARFITESIGIADSVSDAILLLVERILRILSRLFSTEYTIESSIDTEYQITSTLS